MSDANNLSDFFAAQSQRKKKGKAAAPAKKKPAAAEDAAKEEKKEEIVAAAAKPETQPETAQDFADSSDEESNTIVINEGKQKIKDRKELEASKKSKEAESSDATAGWGLGSKMGVVDNTPTTKPGANTAAGGFGTKAAGGGMMSFGKPQFTRKQKGIMDNQDFPDLESANKASGEKEQTKANSS